MSPFYVAWIINRVLVATFLPSTFFPRILPKADDVFLKATPRFVSVQVLWTSMLSGELVPFDWITALLATRKR